MKPSNLLCRWLPGWFKPGWRDCVHASCWSGPDAAVRLRGTIRDAKVWVKEADGRVVGGRMDLPEGWYALPVDGEDLP